MTTQLQVYRDAARFLGDHTVDALDVDEVLRYALDEAYVGGPTFVMRQAAWRFALVTETLSGTAGTTPGGFAYSYAQPATWLRTHSIFKASSTKECPIDFREQNVAWYTNSSTFTIRYVSSFYVTQLDRWTEQFTKAVAAYLAFDVADKITGDPQRRGQLWDLFQQLLVSAQEHDALLDDPWLIHQFDGSFISASRNILQQGFWNFALKTATPSSSGTAVVGFSNAYPKPADWIRTHSIFKLSGSKELPLDCREQGASWSANEAIKVRYISSDYLDSSTWPEEFMRVVAAYLGIDWGDGNARAVTPDEKGGQKQVLWPQYLARAVENIALPPNAWLTFQLNGSFAVGVDAMLESGLWKFAIVTESLTSAGASTSPSYAYYFTKPAAWIRTVRVYQQLGTTTAYPTSDVDIDFRDEGGKLHANMTPIILRYLSSTLGRAPVNWSDDFRQALLAYLEYQQAVGDPKMSGAGMRARQVAYMDAEKNARIKDEMRERPKVNTMGVLRRARGGSSSYAREQGWN